MNSCIDDTITICRILFKRIYSCELNVLKWLFCNTRERHTYTHREINKIEIINECASLDSYGLDQRDRSRIFGGTKIILIYYTQNRISEAKFMSFYIIFLHRFMRLTEFNIQPVLTSLNICPAQLYAVRLSCFSFKKRMQCAHCTQIEFKVCCMHLRMCLKCAYNAFEIFSLLPNVNQGCRTEMKIMHGRCLH